MKKKQTMEDVVHGVFLLLGLVTVGCVLLITVYLILSGLPAITKIGLGNFLFGMEWASTASDPKYGILPFILTSVYGTCGAILLGVPVGFLTAAFLSKMAPKKLRSVMESAVSLLAGIPSVVYGLVGMLVLVPGIRKLFHVPDGASLLAAVERLAEQQGLRNLVAIVTEENEHSLSFHVRHGYREVGRLYKSGFKFGRWLDAVFLQKVLPPFDAEKVQAL